MLEATNEPVAPGQVRDCATRQPSKMAQAHECSFDCGPGSTTVSAREIYMKEERQLRVRVAARSPQRKRMQPYPDMMLLIVVLTGQTCVVMWSAGKRASKNAWTQVYIRPQRAKPLGHNFEIVYVHQTHTDRKLGVFVWGDVPKGHKIICERPVFSCYHWVKGRRTAVPEWLELTHAQREDLRVWFRKLRKVPHGSNDIFEKKDKERLEKFISDYAFSDPQRERAHIYKLTCYINHACRSCANAEIWVDSAAPHTITVRLVKDLKNGDEIFICYNKLTPYGCALCQHGQTLRGRLRAFIYNFGTRKRTANASETEPTSSNATAIENTEPSVPNSSASD